MPRRTVRLPFILAQASPSGATGGDVATKLRPVERNFLLQATEISRSTAEVSRLAVSQATASNVRDLAQQLVVDYEQINRTLEALARRKDLPLPLAPASFSDQYRELASQSGVAFDRAYIRQAAEASQQELRLCETAVAEAKDGDIRDLAGGLLPVVRDHVNRFIELLKTL